MSTETHTDNIETQSPDTDSEVQLGLCDLIRSKADALVVYREACWFSDQDQGEQYELLKYFLDKWDTPEFTKFDAQMVERIVDNLSQTTVSDHNMEYEAPEFGLAKGLLEALAQAARQRVAGSEE